ncbi:MAG: VOC family protein [Anaerolineae bacterium]|nr:VOC family protein [Anaerolineae bacterium]
MRIVELRLHTADLNAQRAFYAETLGLPLLDSSSEMLTFQAGNTRLIFERDSQAGPYHFGFDIPENQFEDAIRWLEKRTSLAFKDGEVRFHFPNWNADAVYFYDPAGNILEFIARHNQPNATDRPFDENSILSVSEIGLATDDVKGTVEAINSALGIGVYDGAGSQNFTAVGDELGLFITVKRGRIWSPETGIVADFQPVQVTIIGEPEGDFSVPGLPYQVRMIRG